MKLTETQVRNLANILIAELKIDRKEANKRIERLFEPSVKKKIEDLSVQFGTRDVIVPIIDYVSLQPSDKELDLSVENITKFISDKLPN